MTLLEKIFKYFLLPVFALALISPVLLIFFFPNENKTIITAACEKGSITIKYKSSIDHSAYVLSYSPHGAFLFGDSDVDSWDRGAIWQIGSYVNSDIINCVEKNKTDINRALQSFLANSNSLVHTLLITTPLSDIQKDISIPYLNILSVDKPEGTAPLRVTFTTSKLGYGKLVNFGDGNEENYAGGGYCAEKTCPEPPKLVHLYKSPGHYRVTLSTMASIDYSLTRPGPNCASLMDVKMSGENVDLSHCPTIILGEVNVTVLSQ
jgi:hypothetical protein